MQQPKRPRPPDWFEEWLTKEWRPFRENELAHLRARVEVNDWLTKATALAVGAALLKLVLS